MKRLAALFFLLPSIGACTVENDYYSPYSADASVTSYRHHPHRHHHYHHRWPYSRAYQGRNNIVVPGAPRQNYYRHDNVYRHDDGIPTYGPNYQPNIHGHD